MISFNMYNNASPRSESNCTFSGNSPFEESSIDPTELLEKFKILIKELEQLIAKRSKKSYENDQGYSNEKFMSKHIKTITDFAKRTTILENENDKLSEEIDVKPENSDQKDLEQSKQELTMDSLKAENIKLRQVCKDISGINKKWQNYNNEVQFYIRQLEEVVQARNPGKSSGSPEKQWTSPRERDTANGIEETDTPHLTRYTNLLKEACQLQKELEDSRRTEEFLRRQLEELRFENCESVKLLNCQLSLYKEDYEAERRERQVAQATSSELSKELNRVTAKFRECQRRLKEVVEVSRSPNGKASRASPGFVFNLIERESHSSRRNDHLVADSSDDVPMTPESSTSPNDEIDEETIPKCASAYECPGCGKTFPSERNIEYLEHFEECQRTEES